MKGRNVDSLERRISMREGRKGKKKKGQERAKEHERGQEKGKERERE